MVGRWSVLWAPVIAALVAAASYVERAEHEVFYPASEVRGRPGLIAVAHTSREQYEWQRPISVFLIVLAIGLAILVVSRILFARGASRTADV